jgi:hypothetical protein
MSFPHVLTCELGVFLRTRLGTSPLSALSKGKVRCHRFFNLGCRSGPSSAQAVEPVKRRCLIAFGERGIVEDGIDEVGDLAL